MKKYIWLLYMGMVFLLLCSCGKKISHENPVYGKDGEYLGFSDLPENYTAKAAVKDGCLVIDNEILRGGLDEWEEFRQKAENGKKAFLRVAYFLNYAAYYQDFYYQDGKYTLFSNDEYGIRKEGSFQYLRALSAGENSPRKEATQYVLTDSLELTFDDVIHSFYTSEMDDVTTIPFYWLQFSIYLRE